MNFVTLLVSILSFHVALGSLGGAAGGWSKVKDLTTIQPEIEFAANHVIQNSADYVLSYASIVGAQQQVVAGMNYKLTLQFDVLASKKGQSNFASVMAYEVVVHKALDQSLSIQSYTEITPTAADTKCAPGAPCQHTTNDPWAQKAAQVAAASISKEKGLDVTLTRIVSVKTQIVAGVNYIMVLSLSNGGQTGAFNVKVYRDLTDNLSLTSWSQQQIGAPDLPPMGPGPVIGGTGLGHVDKPTVLGGFSPVIMTDPLMKNIVTAAAKFALAEIAASTSTQLRFLAVTNPTKQVVAGTNFHFDVEGATTAGSKVFTALVFMPLGEPQDPSNLGAVPFKLVSFSQSFESLPR